MTRLLVLTMIVSVRYASSVRCMQPSVAIVANSTHVKPAVVQETQPQVKPAPVQESPPFAQGIQVGTVLHWKPKYLNATTHTVTGNEACCFCEVSGTPTSGYDIPTRYSYSRDGSCTYCNKGATVKTKKLDYSVFAGYKEKRTVVGHGQGTDDLFKALMTTSSLGGKYKYECQNAWDTLV